MRKDPLVGRPQATPPAADGAKLGGGLEGGRLLDFSGRQSRGWGRERVPPRHDCITIICILCGPIQVRISSINLTYINFTGILYMSVPRSREACSALGTIARPSVYPAERRPGAHFNFPMPTDRAEPNDDCNLFVGSVDSGDRYRSRGRAAGVSEDRAHVAAGTERQAGSGRCCCGC